MAPSSVGSSSAGVFVPKFLEFENICDFADSATAGWDRAKIEEWVGKLKVHLGPLLAKELGYVEIRKKKNFAFKVYFADMRKGTELLGCIQDVIREDHAELRGAKGENLRVNLERAPAEQAKLTTMGELLDGIKYILRENKQDHAYVIEPRWPSEILATDVASSVTCSICTIEDNLYVNWNVQAARAMQLPDAAGVQGVGRRSRRKI